jgi:hypothetical protein
LLDPLVVGGGRRSNTKTQDRVLHILISKKKGKTINAFPVNSFFNFRILNLIDEF